MLRGAADALKLGIDALVSIKVMDLPYIGDWVGYAKFSGSLLFA